MGEITNIQWENSLGEIGLIMNPNYLNKPEQAIDLILEQGFNNLNLENIFGEVYVCSTNWGTWEKVYKKYKGFNIQLPNRKFWHGIYWDSVYFNINREEWKKCQQ